jgi:hypothetical protein
VLAQPADGCAPAIVLLVVEVATGADVDDADGGVDDDELHAADSATTRTAGARANPRRHFLIAGQSVICT